MGAVTIKPAAHSGKNEVTIVGAFKVDHSTRMVYDTDITLTKAGLEELLTKIPSIAAGKAEQIGG